LIALRLAWELWLAPLRTGGSWLALKSLPLLIPLRGMIRHKSYTYRWAMLLVLAYVGEGAVRAYTDVRWSQALAGLELFLALLFFCTAVGYVRVTCASLPRNARGEIRS
jgi:uncharacterized membrane protein